MNDQLADQEDKNASLQKMRKKLESDVDLFKKTVAELETTVKKQESEKANKDLQIRSLQVRITSLLLGPLLLDFYYEERIILRI